MRILLGHGYTDDPGAYDKQRVERWLSRLRAASIDIQAIQIGLDVPGRRLPWKELDRRWRRGDRTLLTLYEKVAQEAVHYDVFINSGCLNMHPSFLRQLSTINVLHMNDDPELSRDFSRPVATAYDLCAIGNIAEVKTYKSWGVQNVCWCPTGFWADDFDPALTYDDILSRDRDVDVALLCERRTAWRRRRVDQFALAFPQGVYRGLGWPQGFLPERERVPLLQRTRVGINIHNTTGPINFRTFYLPANGVLQLCDNKSYLGRIFALGKEVIGYDTIDEAIDLCRYYLEHEDERRAIAAAGWQRALADYNEVAAFRYLTRAVETLQASESRQPASQDIRIFLDEQRQQSRLRRAAYTIGLPMTWLYRQSVRYVRGASRRLRRWWDNSLYWLRSRQV